MKTSKLNAKDAVIVRELAGRVADRGVVSLAHAVRG